jgi:hypothetical protein
LTRAALILTALAVGGAVLTSGAEGGGGSTAGLATKGPGITAAASTPSLSVCGGHPHRHGVARFQRVLDRAWERSDPYDDSPMSAKQQARLRHFRTCSRPGTLDEMKDRARAARKSYHRWSERRRFMLSLPYRCVGHGRWAVPCAVVSCESGYSWTATNGPHLGPYQVNVEVWGYLPWPATSFNDRRAHHEMALRILREQGAGAWSCW